MMHFAKIPGLLSLGRGVHQLSDKLKGSWQTFTGSQHGVKRPLGQSQGSGINAPISRWQIPYVPAMFPVALPQNQLVCCTIPGQE